MKTIKKLNRDVILINKIFSFLEEKEKDLTVYEDLLEEEKKAIDEKLGEVEFQRQRIQKLL